MTKPKNFLLLLAAIAFVALGGMAYMVYYQDQILKNMDNATLTLSKQSTSSETEFIENDLTDTDFADLDQELSLIEKELESD